MLFVLVGTRRAVSVGFVSQKQTLRGVLSCHLFHAAFCRTITPPHVTARFFLILPPPRDCIKGLTCEKANAIVDLYNKLWYNIYNHPKHRKKSARGILACRCDLGGLYEEKWSDTHNGCAAGVRMSSFCGCPCGSCTGNAGTAGHHPHQPDAERRTACTACDICGRHGADAFQNIRIRCRGAAECSESAVQL